MGSEESPLSLRIGSTYLTPVGFMDFTGVFRDTDAGSGIGTNFGSFPYRPQTSVQGNLSEIRLSPQNSRIGARFDAMVKGTKVLAYWESDFLGAIGNPPIGNVAVSTDSYPLRLRLFWVDLKKDKWEVLGGQTWTLMTPGRNGISPLPGDIFYSQVVDVNYTVGMPWGRHPRGPVRLPSHESGFDGVRAGQSGTVHRRFGGWRDGRSAFRARHTATGAS